MRIISSNKFGLFFLIHVFISFGVTKTKQQDSFYFDPAPINQDAVEGEEVRLRCDVSNRKLILFYWTLNNKQLSNTSRRYQEDSDLRIVRADRNQDTGSFRCIATNVSTGIALRSTEAKLSILWIDKSSEVQLQKPKAEELVEGVEVNLKCQADGSPDPTVEWFRNRVRLFPGDRIRVTKNRVRITELYSSDNGVYSCRARNVAGTAESSDIFLLNVAGVDVPRLKEETFTRVLLVKEKSDAIFNCEYSNAVVTEWYFSNNTLIVSGSKQKYFVMKNGTLIIRNVRSEDAGVYFCAGVGDKEAAQMFASELLLAYLSDFTESAFEPKPSSLQMVIAPVSGKLDIRCLPPNGLPPPVQRWVNPYGMEISDQGRIKVVDGLLSITNAEELDGGNYTCQAENLAGKKTKNVWIVISVPPKISRPPLSVRVTEKEVATFDCKITGTAFPVTTVSWKKDDMTLDKLTDERFVIDSNVGSLKIEDVEMSDEGNYACIVNTEGHPPITSSNAHLYVEKQLKFKPTPVHSKLELGSNSSLRCKAEGRVPPRIRWYKDNVLVQPPPGVGGLQDVGDSTLYFYGVKDNDKGIYTCIASNDQGVINATIKVDIVVRPKFKVKPLNSTAYEGYPIMLHCVAVGDPQPMIQWDKNGKVNSFDLNRFKVLSNGSLHISEIYMEDVGKYGCTAGNSGGFERAEVFLHVSSHKKEGEGDDQSNGESFNMTKTIIIAVCSAVAYLAIVIGLTVYCSIRLLRNMRRRQSNVNRDDKGGENGNIPNEMTELVEKKSGDHLVVNGDFDVGKGSDGRSGVGSHSSQSQNVSLHGGGTLKSFEKNISFPRNQLQTLGKLGKSHYGDVFVAKAYGIRDGEKETLVIIKSLLSYTNEHDREFQREIEMFGKLAVHRHIASLLGICREMEPFYLITEYCEWGDLKQFLLHMRRETGRPSANRLALTNPNQMLTMCCQIAIGMEHLSNSRFVHRDLAARNVLVMPNLDLKIANPALCRDVYVIDYFPYHQHLIPLRWMAPEAVLEQEFSMKSDVWSFGIFAWEVFTHAEQPYSQRCDEDLLAELRLGSSQLEHLPDCPLKMWKTIERCISLGPNDRPDFGELAITISNMMAETNL